MNVQLKNHTLLIQINRDFNLYTKMMLEKHLTSEIDSLEINLSRCKLMDSETVIFLHKWLHSGKKLTLIDPPEIFFKIISSLGLDNEWDLNAVVKQTREPKNGRPES